MDQPTGQPRAGAQQTQAAAQRDTMYCHECHDEWYRDEHGLTCPECGSDFTEIIEAEHDPRDDQLLNNDDDDESMPSLEDLHPLHPHLHPLHDHNPWRDSSGPVPGFSVRTAPGSIAITSTFVRTIPSPRGGGAAGGQDSPHFNPVMANFTTMLNSIVGGARQAGQQRRQNEEQSHNEGRGPMLGDQNSQNPGDQTTPGASAEAGSGQTPGGHRFTYTQSARLFPRDSHSPHPQMEPVDDLNNVLLELVMGLADAPGRHPPPTGDHPPHVHAHVHFNPIAALLSNMIPGLGGTGAVGDAVYSQEALDRIISQLMEQNATGNAPGPASQEDIKNLSKKEVTAEMIGPEGHAECSICMDEVLIGEQVTDLPCHHWFHEQCISAWLGEHDTCPHCRKGISKHDAPPNNASGAVPSNYDASHPPMPGSFGVTGEGTTQNPFIVPDSPERRREQGVTSDQQGRPSTSESGGHEHGGFSERLRGLFGPPR